MSTAKPHGSPGAQGFRKIDCNPQGRAASNGGEEDFGEFPREGYRGRRQNAPAPVRATDNRVPHTKTPVRATDNRVPHTKTPRPTWRFVRDSATRIRASAAANRRSGAPPSRPWRYGGQAAGHTPVFALTRYAVASGSTGHNDCLVGRVGRVGGWRLRHTANRRLQTFTRPGTGLGLRKERMVTDGYGGNGVFP